MVANFCVGMKRGSTWGNAGDDEEEEKNITDVYYIMRMLHCSIKINVSVLIEYDN